jgi:hypothetical protein
MPETAKFGAWLLAGSKNEDAIYSGAIVDRRHGAD